jgi:hypothetical protein
MTCSTEGDLGDATYLLGILSKLDGGPHTLLLEASPVTKAKGPEGVARLDAAFSPLANAQPYIKECRIIREGEQVDWKSADFRKAGYTYGKTLMAAHLDHLINVLGVGHGIDGKEQWLTVEPSTETKGCVVINRTARYRNSSFYWDEIVKHYSYRLVFVGLHHEWKEFCAHFGYVSFRPTANLLEVAQLIAGSDLFIGNQSCANACAEGLKHRSIQETSLIHPDCIFKRDNAQFVHNGYCVLPDVDGSGERVLKARQPELDNISTMISPPGNWQFPGCSPCISFEQIMGIVKRLPDWSDKTKEEVRYAILQYTMDRCPTFGRNQQETAKAEIALQAAGYC